jgi:hypothetical protein
MRLLTVRRRHTLVNVFLVEGKFDRRGEGDKGEVVEVLVLWGTVACLLNGLLLLSKREWAGGQAGVYKREAKNTNEQTNGFFFSFVRASGCVSDRA